jgi:uncharacterized protein (TIGR03382 family)
MASFNVLYGAQLEALGGTPPYTWELLKGKLPEGLEMSSTGRLSGVPQRDGVFALTFRVTDSTGQSQSQTLNLEVQAPSSPTCVTRELPILALGEEIARPGHAIVVAGVSGGAYSTRETRRAAEGYGKYEPIPATQPPKGLSLSMTTGVVTGTPEEMGTYLWTVTVKMPGKPDVSCPVVVRVPVDQGLTLLTQSLPDAVAGTSYRARLQVAGATGKVKWFPADKARFPAGLDLNEDTGEIEGTMSTDLLEGEKERTFTFLVHASDEQNRHGSGSLSITLRDSPADRTLPTVTKETGCQAGGGSGLAWLAAALGLALLRRRR